MELISTTGLQQMDKAVELIKRGVEGKPVNMDQVEGLLGKSEKSITLSKLPLEED